MHIRRSLLVAVLTAVMTLLLPAVAHATTYYDAVNGTNTATGLSTSTAFATVQHAVGVAASGDVVAVGSGTFNGAITM